MPKKTIEREIPADLMAMTIEQLQAESESHDSGAIRQERFRLVQIRDEAKAEIERLVERRNDINRALSLKYMAEINAREAKGRKGKGK